jgi:hypothetical protein
VMEVVVASGDGVLKNVRTLQVFLLVTSHINHSSFGRFLLLTIFLLSLSSWNIKINTQPFGSFFLVRSAFSGLWNAFILNSSYSLRRLSLAAHLHHCRTPALMVHLYQPPNTSVEHAHPPDNHIGICLTPLFYHRTNKTPVSKIGI